MGVVALTVFGRPPWVFPGKAGIQDLWARWHEHICSGLVDYEHEQEHGVCEGISS